MMPYKPEQHANSPVSSLMADMLFVIDVVFRIEAHSFDLCEKIVFDDLSLH